MELSLLCNSTWWLVVSFLALVVFLIMLNGFLRGTWKEYVDVFLGLCWVVLIVISFIYFGYKIGLFNLLGSIIFGAIVYSIAARVAAKLLGR